MDIMIRGWRVYSLGFLIFLCMPIPDIMRRKEPDQVRYIAPHYRLELAGP